MWETQLPSRGVSPTALYVVRCNCSICMYSYKGIGDSEYPQTKTAYLNFCMFLYETIQMAVGNCIVEIIC